MRARTAFSGLQDAPLAAADARPLAGKRIVVTRASEQAGMLARRLTALGAEVIALPLLEFVPPEDTAAFDRALWDLERFDWLLFTSQNAVEFFCQRCRKLGIPLHHLAQRVRVGAVGPATAEAAGKADLPADCVSPKAQGLALAGELGNRVKGKRILLPRSDRARADLPAALREAGAEVVDVVAYRTAAGAAAGLGQNHIESLLRGEADVVILASPSAWQRLRELFSAEDLGRVAKSVLFAAIGPVTAEAIRQAGFTPAIVAAQSTSAGLADAIVKYYAASREERGSRR